MNDPSETVYSRVPLESLQRFATDCFCRSGMPAEDARTAAELLVRADLRGIETHGVTWLPSYSRSLRAGKINPTPQVHIDDGMGALLQVDGDGGLGHVVTARAMSACIERAESLGMCSAVVRNSRHNGAAGLYTLAAIEAGMIGLSLTGGGVRVAPAGGSEALLGTNPIAFGAPAGEEAPFVIDMATSVVAGAKVSLYARKGLPLPEGWALDSEGRPTTDPAAAEAGCLLPLGGSLETGSYKGFALGWVVETLCNLMSGMATGPERARGEGPTAGGMGHFVGAIRIAGFEPLGEFRRRMDWNLRTLRSSRPAAGVERVYTPGELEFERERERREAGIPLHATTIQALDDLAGELGIERLSYQPRA